MYRLLVALLMLGGGAYPVYAQTLITLDSFNNTDGNDPQAGLIADAAGNLFGTTYGGGTSGIGTVFEVAKTGNTYGSPTTLVNFGGTNGSHPFAALITDSSGNLFGTTEIGGTSNGGTVFEIARTGSTYGSLITLASFNGTNGAQPLAGLIADPGGNLFGTTSVGGTGVGTVFEIAKTGGAYGSLTTLANFDGTNRSFPYAGLIADGGGNLFGTTEMGGPSNAGTVFEIAKTGSTYGSPTTLFNFNGMNGSSPLAGLVVDAAGNLFGTTARGGTTNVGTVFEIARGGSTYTSFTSLANFDGPNGSLPSAGLIADAAGNLFGTTYSGGGFGTVFEIAKIGGTYGSPTTLVNFNGMNGKGPLAALIADSSGNLFGTTTIGGTAGYGTVFEITNSGYVTSLSNTSVPEPASLAILGAGGLILGAIRRRTGDKKLTRI